MSNTIVYMLKNTSDSQIESLYKQLYDNDLFLLFNTLEFMDSDIQAKWIGIYNKLYSKNA